MSNQTIDEIKEKAVPILKEAGVLRSSIFGSYVRGEQKEDSDIDILVELPVDKSLLDLVRLQRKLRTVLGKDVDLLTYNSVHPLLKKYIQKDQLPIL
jgi:predicted nucleotidyltransferase